MFWITIRELKERIELLEYEAQQLMKVVHVIRHPEDSNVLRPDLGDDHGNDRLRTFKDRYRIKYYGNTNDPAQFGRHQL